MVSCMDVRGNQDVDQFPADSAIWTGSYETWSSCSHAGISLDLNLAQQSNFESARWIQRQLDMYELARVGTFPRMTFLPSVVSMLGVTRIVDFGGGSGWSYELLDPTDAENLDNYLVIEQPDVVHAMRSVVNISGEIQFADFDEISPCESSHSGLLYANSVIQYLPSHSDFQDVLERLRPEWVLFDDLQVSRGTEFFSLQRYYGNHIPTRFLELKELQDAMSQLGFVPSGTWLYPKTYSPNTVPRIVNTSSHLHSPSSPVSSLYRFMSDSVSGQASDE